MLCTLWIKNYYKFCTENLWSLGDNNWLKIEWYLHVHALFLRLVIVYCELTKIGTSPHLPVPRWNIWIPTINQTGSFDKFIVISPLIPYRKDWFALKSFRVADSQWRNFRSIEVWLGVETAEVRHYVTLKRKLLINEIF